MFEKTIHRYIKQHNGKVKLETEAEIIAFFKEEADMISCKIDLTSLGIQCYNYMLKELVIRV